MNLVTLTLVLLLFGGLGGSRLPWSYGYGFGHGSVSLLGVVLMLTGRL